MKIASLQKVIAPLFDPYLSSKPFYLIHSDVWGPSEIETHSGKCWFLTLIDDHTCLSWVFLLTKTIWGEGCFHMFLQYDWNPIFNQNSYLTYSDNGIEYFNELLSAFFKNKGIVHQSTCQDTSQQNGITKHKIGHLLEGCSGHSVYYECS